MFVTPPGLWHSHYNESGGDAHLLPVQDAGLHTHLRTLDIHFYHKEKDIRDLETQRAEPTSLIGGYSHPELKHLLGQGLAKLNSQQRRVLELASYDGLSMAEIAAKTGDTVSNVRHYYYRGLKKLRSLIQGEGLGDK